VAARPAGQPPRLRRGHLRRPAQLTPGGRPPYLANG
jgi:hypothetical protein